MSIENKPDRPISFISGTAVFPNHDRLSVGQNFLEVFRDAMEFTGPVEKFMRQDEDIAHLDEVTKEMEFFDRWYRARFTPVKSKRKASLGGKDMLGKFIEGTTKVESVVIVMADITAKHLSDLALRQSSEEKSALAERESAALKATQLKSAFLANASHEIRTYVIYSLLCSSPRVLRHEFSRC